MTDISSHKKLNQNLHVSILLLAEKITPGFSKTLIRDWSKNSLGIRFTICGQDCAFFGWTHNDLFQNLKKNLL